MGQPFGPQTKKIQSCRICGVPAPYTDLCATHRERIRRGRSLDIPIRFQGQSDCEKVTAILARSAVEGECLHAANIGSNGYATSVKDEAGRSIQTHRLVYRVMNGDLGKLQVHHACANKACINPKHLVLATQLQNTAEMHARRAYETRIAALEAEIAELKERAQ